MRRDIAMCFGVLAALAVIAARADGAQAGGQGVVAPRLPTPPSGADAAPWHYLTDARTALLRHRRGAAEEALERAETRLLAPLPPNSPDTAAYARYLHAATAARQALRAGDTTQAERILTAALAAPAASQAASRVPAAPPPVGTTPPAASGGWYWSGSGWVFYPAHPPYLGAAWVPAHWAWRGAWVWVPGHWRR